MLPEHPTLVDILTKRLHVPRFNFPFSVLRHGVQAATLALKAGLDDETVLA
jgi:predicted HD phosphohydrolase